MKHYSQDEIKKNETGHVICPSCSHEIQSDMWTNPACPACGNHNAILEGTCRDCKTKHPKLRDAIEWFCTSCRERILVTPNIFRDVTPL